MDFPTILPVLGGIVDLEVLEVGEISYLGYVVFEDDESGISGATPRARFHRRTPGVTLPVVQCTEYVNRIALLMPRKQSCLKIIPYISIHKRYACLLDCAQELLLLHPVSESANGQGERVFDLLIVIAREDPVDQQRLVVLLMHEIRILTMPIRLGIVRKQAPFRDNLWHELRGFGRQQVVALVAARHNAGLRRTGALAGWLVQDLGLRVHLGAWSPEVNGLPGLWV